MTDSSSSWGKLRAKSSNIDRRRSLHLEAGGHNKRAEAGIRRGSGEEAGIRRGSGEESVIRRSSAEEAVIRRSSGEEAVIRRGSGSAIDPFSPRRSDFYIAGGGGDGKLGGRLIEEMDDAFERDSGIGDCFQIISFFSLNRF